MPWVTIANVKGPKGDKGDPGLGSENALQFKTATPSGDVSTWYGLANFGIVRLPTQTVVNAVAGRPTGARPGNVLILPVGSTASTVSWVEIGDDARIWDRTVSSDSALATGWVRRVKTKRVGTSLTLTGGVTAQVRTDFGGRLPINFGVDIPRWRVHLRNYNLRDSGSFTGALSIVGLSIGEAEVDADGQYTGNWVAGTEQLLQTSGQSTPSTGSEFITTFFDYPLSKDKAYLLSYAFTGAAGQQVVEAQGGGFILTNGSVAVHSPSTPSTMSKTMPLMVWIEAEVPESTPVLGGVGDSLTVGVSATLPVHDSWLAKLARAKGALPMFWAASGDTLANFSNDLAWKFHQWKLLARPDVVYFAMGSNDIFGAGATLADMKARFYACWLKLRAFAGSNLVLCSIFPRFDGAAAAEQVRKDYNAWLRDELPGGASYFLDLAAAITNPDASTLDLAYAASSTDIHLKSSGYARVASLAGGTMTMFKQRYVVREAAGRTVSVWDYVNNREQLIYGVTGWRNITASVPTVVAGTIHLFREGSEVTISLLDLKLSNPATGILTLDSLLPPGFRNYLWAGGVLGSGQQVRAVSGGGLRIYGHDPAQVYVGDFKVKTVDPWPSTLPGTANGAIPYQ